MSGKRFIVSEGREGYLWGFFGLSEGGGWDITGRLEAEILIEGAVLQLYSKEMIKWHPSFSLLLERWYNVRKYPQWEFRTILRHSVRRQEIRVLKAVFLSPPDLFEEKNPRGELRYDPSRLVVIMSITDVRNPTTVQIALPTSLLPGRERQ